MTVECSSHRDYRHTKPRCGEGCGTPLLQEFTVITSNCRNIVKLKNRFDQAKKPEKLSTINHFNNYNHYDCFNHYQDTDCNTSHYWSTL